MKFQKINFVDEISKILSSQVDYENDLDSIGNNIFIALKLYEMVHNLKLKQETDNDNDNMKTYTSNLTKDSDFSYYISRYEDYRKYFNIDLTEDEVDEFKKNFNIDNVSLDFNDINSFEELMDKDKFQTGLKNPLSFKPILFLAELYTEYSRKHRNVIKLFIQGS